MKFWVFDNKDNNIYQYKDIKDVFVCEQCKTNPNDGLCRHNRTCVTKNINNYRFVFCLDKGIVGKNAKHIVKITVDAYFKASTVQKNIQNDLTSIEAITYHNVKKLNAGIGLKLERHIDEDLLAKSQNKVKTIEAIIIAKKEDCAREILSIMKSIRQIESEYAFVDSLRSQTLIKDLTKHKAHTVVLTSFYMFEEEFQKKNIRVIIQKFTEHILVDFAMARSAISQIFSNAVKYCKPHSEINVTFLNDVDTTIINFEMESRFFTNDEAKSFFMHAVRGSNSNGIQGEGIGLFAAYKMMQMNGGYIFCHSNENTRYSSDNIDYSNNTFSLGFRKNPH